MNLIKINDFQYECIDKDYRYLIELHWPSLFVPNMQHIKHNAYIFYKNKLLYMLHDSGGRIKAKDCTFERAKEWLENFSS